VPDPREVNLTGNKKERSMGSGFRFQELGQSLIPSKGGRCTMRPINVLYVLGTIVILVLAAAPAFGATFLNYDDGTAEVGVGLDLDAAAALELTNASVDTNVVGIQFYVYGVGDPTPNTFKIYIYDKGVTEPFGPGNLLYEGSTTTTPTATGFTGWLPIIAKAPTGSTFFAIVKRVAGAEASKTTIGVDTGSGNADKAWIFDPLSGEWALAGVSGVWMIQTGAAVTADLASAKGDLSGNDGVVDVEDVVKSIVFALKKQTADAFAEFIGDLNNDGIIDVEDVVKLIRVALKKETI